MSLLEAHYIHQTCDLLDGLFSMFPENTGKYIWNILFYHPAYLSDLVYFVPFKHLFKTHMCILKICQKT